MENEFSIEQFQEAISASVRAGMSEALLDHEMSKDGGFYVTESGETKSFGDWLRAVKDNDKQVLAQFKTLEVVTGASGGYTVPVAFQPRLLAIAAEASIVRPRALVLPVPGETLDIPSLDQTGDPGAGETNRLGGIRLDWTEEGATKPETEPSFKQVALHLHELSGHCYVTDRLLRASGLALDRVLTSLFGNALADESDYAYISGDHVGKPQGIISAPCTIQPVRTGANAIVWADVIAMYHAFLHGPNGVWLINPCCIEQILELKDGNNNLLWVPNISGPIPTRLLGYEIIWTDKVPALGTKGDICLCDFSYYALGDGEIAVESSPHYRFTSNQTTFRFHILTDGQPWLSAPLYTRGGDYQVSPFVALDAYGA